MLKKDIKYINKIYSNRYNQKIPGYKKVGWGSKSSQNLRFRILTENLDLNNKTILDVGCGFADLYIYLTKYKKFKLKKYVGIDICENFIHHNIKKFYKDKKVEFIHCQISELKNIKFDYSFLSGSLNLKINNNINELTSTMSMMYNISKISCSLNFLSIYVDFMNLKDYHYDPSKIFDIAKKICPYIMLRHDYKLYEFTIFLNKYGN